jgi:hypothetical protein
MPKNGDVTGLVHFVEIIDPHLSIVWDDEPTYFKVPTQEMVAPAKKGTYFNVPTQPVQSAPVKKPTYFNVPAQATKRNVYFQIPSNNGGK